MTPDEAKAFIYKHIKQLREDMVGGKACVKDVEHSFNACNTMLQYIHYIEYGFPVSWVRIEPPPPSTAHHGMYPHIPKA